MAKEGSTISGLAGPKNGQPALRPLSLYATKEAMNRLPRIVMVVLPATVCATGLRCASTSGPGDGSADGRPERDDGATEESGWPDADGGAGDGAVGEDEWEVTGDGVDNNEAPPTPPRMDFGYYRIDTVPAGGESYVRMVKGWTNLAYVDWYVDARAFDYPEGADMTQVRANMDGILQRVTDQDLLVMMDVGYGAAWGPRLTRQAIFETARPYWDRVAYVMMGDELQLSLADAGQAIDDLRTAMNNLGLPSRPIGVTLTPDYVLGNPEMLQADWDYIAVEAYTPACSCGACGDGTSEEEVQAVASHVALQEAVIPAAVDLVLILQGYDRNGAFSNIDALVEINRASYFQIARDNPRYVAMTIFAWQREGSTCPSNPYPAHGHGSSGYPQLQAVHQEIWRDLTAP
jgi:hypothetical protein